MRPFVSRFFRKRKLSYYLQRGAQSAAILFVLRRVMMFAALYDDKFVILLQKITQFDGGRERQQFISVP